MSLRCIYVTLFFVLFISHLFADDENKKGDKPKEDSKVVRTDSILNADTSRAETEDTLVFEDWEKPKGGTIKGNDIDNELLVANGKSVKIAPATSFKIIDLPIDEEIKSAPLEITIYPNPAVEILYFLSPDAPKSIRIVNLQGTLQNVKILPQSADVSHLPQGTYFIQLIFTNRIESRKFIKS